MNRIIAILTVFLLQLACMQVASAENNVIVSMHAFKVVTTAAGSKLVATAAAQPGDTIEYQVTYSNNGATAARDVLATLPVPTTGLVYVPASAMPATVQASVDGVTYAALPLMRTVTRAGKPVAEAIPVTEYRFLRWKLGDIQPGKSSTVSSRMRLDSADVNNSLTNVRS